MLCAPTCRWLFVGDAEAASLASNSSAIYAELLRLLSPCTLPIPPTCLVARFQVQRERILSMTVACFLSLAMIVLDATVLARSQVVLAYRYPSRSWRGW